MIIHKLGMILGYLFALSVALHYCLALHGCLSSLQSCFPVRFQHRPAWLSLIIRALHGCLFTYALFGSLFTLLFDYFCILVYITTLLVCPSKFERHHDKTSIRPVWSESSLSAQWVAFSKRMLFCWFCHDAAHLRVNTAVLLGCQFSLQSCIAVCHHCNSARLSFLSTLQNY